MPVCGTPVPPGGKLDLWAPSLRSDGHYEPAWCRSLLSPSALLRPLVVNITLKTPIPVQPSETAGFVTRRLGGEAPSSREPAYPRGREPCAGRAANWAGAKARGARALGQVLFIYLKLMALASLSKSSILSLFRGMEKKKRVPSAVRNYSSIKKHTEFLLWRKAAVSL